MKTKKRKKKKKPGKQGDENEEESKVRACAIVHVYIYTCIIGRLLCTV